MKLKNILVPIDFSDCSDNALSYAIELAQRSNAKLTLLNCYTILSPAEEYPADLQPTLATKYRKTAEKNFNHLKEKTGDLSKVIHEELIKLSFVKDGIAETAYETKAELIVMGTKGADNRLDVFFGSNAYRTIKKSNTPVLTVPDKALFKPIKKILFAADFKYIADIHDLDVIKTIMSLFKSKVEILHVGHGWSELSMHQTEEAAAIVDYFGNTDHSYHFIKEEGDVEEAIDDHLEAHHNELLILVPREHHLPGALFQKKVTKRKVMYSELPLLIMSNLK